MTHYTLDEIGTRLAIPYLPNIYKNNISVQTEREKDGEKEILTLAKNDKRLVIDIHIKSTGMNPTLRLLFEERARGQFEAIPCFCLSDENGPIQPKLGHVQMEAVSQFYRQHIGL